MIEYALPALFAVFVWWFTTGAILYLDGLPDRTFRWSMAGASVLALAALAGLAATRGGDSIASAYGAFTCAVLVWGWVEMSFLMGYVTGPRKIAVPADCSDWQRFRGAVGVILYHELAIAAAALLVFAATWGGGNRVGVWTFTVLWAMRLSAKLNLFLGVRNLGTEFLPDRLRYLESFFVRRPVNLLFPIAVTAATAAAGVLWTEALAAHTGPAETVGLVLVASLLTLAILEHWFMVLPLPTDWLWRWGMRTHRGSDVTRRAAAEPLAPPRPAAAS